MIKAEELRIGNLLNWNGCICPVVSIEEDGFTVADIGQNKLSSNYHYSPDEVITHLELSEDWIVKFGFRKMGGNYFLPLPQITAELHYEDGVVFLYSNQWRLFLDIKYVHQLQNLVYSLVGRELGIKL